MTWPGQVTLSMGRFSSHFINISFSLTLENISKTKFYFVSMITLVYLINMLHILLSFWKIPSCMYINFGKFQAKIFIFTNKKWKIPTCTALFQPAQLLILGILPACTFIPSCTIIRYTKVNVLDGINVMVGKISKI